MEEKIRERLKELQEQRQMLVEQATLQVAHMDGAIEALKELLPKKAAVQEEESNVVPRLEPTSTD